MASSDQQVTAAATPAKRGDVAFPMKMLVLCASLTLALAGIGAWNAWTLYSGFRELASNEVRLMRLGGEIMHLDEVLTMSARMAASTGEPRWERRYDQADPVLVAKIAEVIAIAPEAYGRGAASDTDEANAKLVELERQAFDRVHRGDLTGATKLLFSSDYERHKQIYAAGMQRSMRAAGKRVDALLAAFHRRAVISVGLAIAVLVLLGGCWLQIARLILRHLRARRQADGALHQANATLERKVDERTAALAAANALLQDSLDNLRNAQRELVAASRKAGMADVARAVLHNVGNVLNSVNVSANLAADLVRRSKVSGLVKAAELLKEHQGELGTFLTGDARGKHLPEYLWTVSDRLRGEQASLLDELESLQGNIDHIKTIIARQQQHAASVASTFEVVRPTEIADEAIALVKRACDEQGIVFARQYADLPAAVIDRHRALQIVVNLLSNARQALGNVQGARTITVRASAAEDGQFMIEVTDNGCGIAADHVPKLFQPGFTTKREGHGLGLHSSACLAKELGGSLHGASDGPGRGARFALVLPIDRAATAA